MEEQSKSNYYIPQTHQSLSQLQTQFGIISSSPNSGLTQVSADIVKPTTVYTYQTSSNNGGVVQLNESNSILPQTNIYSSFDPNFNKQVTVTTTTVTQHKKAPSQNTIQISKSVIPEYNPYQYAVQQVAQQPIEDEKVKKTKNKNGQNSDSSDSSDDENKQVTELKFNKQNNDQTFILIKRVWKQSYILLAKKIIEDLNSKVAQKDAHISSLIKATDLKDEQISKMSVEINQIRQQNGYSININASNSQEYLILQRKSEELEQDNRQLAQIVQQKEEERYELLSNIVLLNTQIEAQLSANKTQTVVLQSNYSAETEIWKQKCGQLEAELQNIRLSQNTQNNYQLELLNIQIRDKNSELEHLRQQLSQVQVNKEVQTRLEIENKSLQSQIQSLNSQIATLNIQITQVRGSTVEQQNSSLKINTLELKIKDYETQIQLLQTQINQLSGSKQRLEEMESQLINMNDEIQKKQNEVNLYSQRCQELENQLSQYNRLIQELQLKLEQQDYEIKKSSSRTNDQELIQLRKSLEELTVNKSMLEAQIQELNNQIYNISQQLKIQNQDSSDLRTRCDNLTRQLSEYESKYQKANAQLQESEYNNKVIIGQNNEFITKIKLFEQQISQYQGQINQIYLYETQLQQLQQSYFNILTQFVLVSSVLESQSGNKQPSSIDINYYQNNDMEIKILRQDNTDLANKCVLLQNQLNSKTLESEKLLTQFTEIEMNNKIIIGQNSDLQRQLRDKDTEIITLKSSQTSSIQIITLQQEANDWKSKYETSRNDILVVAQQVEKLKSFLSEKDQEVITWKNKANSSMYLQQENEKLRIQVQQISFLAFIYLSKYCKQKYRNLEEEILKRTDRISAPDNNHQLIQQLMYFKSFYQSQKDSELEEHKKRLAAYALKNAEQQAEIEFLKNKKLSGGQDDSSISSQADKDQLIHKYRIENKRLNDNLQELQQLIKIQQNEIRYQKGVKGCGYGCN